MNFISDEGLVVKRLLLYLFRWQLSTPILFLCVTLMPFNNMIKTILANLIGGLIFFQIDKWIFKNNSKTDNLRKEIGDEDNK